MTGSVLFYVQHLLGIGHVQRALRLAAAMTRRGLEVTLVSGGEPLAALAGAEASRVVQLPPIRARDANFKDLVGPGDRPIDESLCAARREAVLAAFAAARPDAVLLEAFPFGRRAFRFELDPLIAAARGRFPRALMLCSVRDIVVPPGEPRRLQEIVDRVRSEFDTVLVHGDPQLIPFEASFPAAAQIAGRFRYTGYVGALDKTRRSPADGTGEVLVSAGGGAVGGRLLATALEVRCRGCLADLGWRLLAGPNLPQAEFDALQARLPPGVHLERFRADFRQRLRQARVSISQAGYNTVLDLLEAGTAAVLVPFAGGRETEQSLRAERLAARGLVEAISEAELSPETLKQAILRAVSARPAVLAIDTGGALRTACLIASMIDDLRRAVENFVTSPSQDMISK